MKIRNKITIYLKIKYWLSVLCIYFCIIWNIWKLDYYPFGLQQKGYNDVITSNKNDVAERFKYNGKENNPELGLEWYDFRARNYDVALGRWMNIDPLADQMRVLSRYFNESVILKKLKY